MCALGPFLREIVILVHWDGQDIVYVRVLQVIFFFFPSWRHSGVLISSFRLEKHIERCPHTSIILCSIQQENKWYLWITKRVDIEELTMSYKNDEISQLIIAGCWRVHQLEPVTCALLWTITPANLLQKEESRKKSFNGFWSCL